MVFNTYHHTRMCLSQKMQIDEKKFANFVLPISSKATLELSLTSRFSIKSTFFDFYQNFGFNFGISSNNYFQLKKQVKIDPETRSYHFLTKTHEKNPRSGTLRDLEVTSEKQISWGSSIFKEDSNSQQTFQKNSK